MGRIKDLGFALPPPPVVVIDEKVNAYIEKLRNENEFTGPLSIKLDDFEGPLDMLLFLVKQSKLRIEDIFVSKITDQYLSLMDGVDAIDINKASEFIEIASMLLEIKSKALLPKTEFEKESVDDLKRELIRKVEEYRLYKEAGEKMKKTETVGIFYKEPDPSVGDPLVILRDMTKDGLYAAMQKLFLKLSSRPPAALPRKIELDRFTVAEKIAGIKEVMLLRDEVNFFELFEDDYTKSEIITTFLALLELLKMQEVTAVQPEIFADITIRRNENEKERIESGEN